MNASLQYILRLHIKLWSEWVCAFSSSTWCCCCFEGKNFRVWRRMKDDDEDEEKIEKQTSLHYTEEHLSLSGISFNFSCWTFFLASPSTLRIYIMMEILNLLIYFIFILFYIRDFIFIDFHLSPHLKLLLRVICLPIYIIRRFILFLCFEKSFITFSINLMWIYCSRVR